MTSLPSFPTPAELASDSYRRPSYANVAAGTAAGPVPDSFEELSTSNPSSRGADARSPVPSPVHSRHPSRGMEMDRQSGDGAWKRDTGGSWVDRGGAEDHQPFFTPSYLQASRHVQQLHRAYEERIAQSREDALLNHPKQPPLSTSSSNVNLSKMHSSHIHRPAVQDVIERLPPPSAEDLSHPLPSRWSDEDKMSGLELLADGAEVRFAGVTKTTDEAASIRTDHPMPKECGLYYFEITVISRGKDGLIGIGFSAKKANLNRLPGWEADSWAYHGDDGYSFSCTSNGKSYGPKFSGQDVIGCGVNFRTGTAFFTKNGVFVGTAFHNIRTDNLYPSIGIKKPGEHLRANFGRTPFVFDIDQMMERERKAILEKINNFDVSKLHPTDNEKTLVQRLVAQYLAHEGYVETAQAFAEDVHRQQQSLTADPQPFQAPNSDDDIHAINRQKIRRSILDGNIDKALKYTSTYYPDVLEDERNKDIHFRLKCRKFIEMMRRYSDLATTSSSPTAVTKSIDSLASNGHAAAPAAEDEDEDDAQMELDEQLHRESHKQFPPTDDVDMDASQELPSKSSLMKEGNLLNTVIAYGQELQHEFGSDPRPHVKKQLGDLFAIIAYENPLDSPIGLMLDPQGRVQIAEEVNGAILVSLGKPSSAALEKLCAQTEALLDETATKTGGASAFINVRRDFMRP